MAKRTNAERLEKKQAELAAAKKRLAAEQAKINRLGKEIAELENFEILALSKELNKPTAEIRSLLLELVEKRQSAAEQE
jgi:phage terminase Nu1 subunit (DNA packaging protein)